MPFFEFHGYGRDTGRARKRTLLASNPEDLISLAASDGTIVDAQSIRRVFPIEHFFSKVVGVSHTNSDGVSRQSLISQCQPPEFLRLTRERKNRFSPHAIAVIHPCLGQLGYIPDETAEGMCGNPKAPFYVCFSSQVTGQEETYLGLNLLIISAQDAETDTSLVSKYILEQTGMTVSTPE